MEKAVRGWMCILLVLLMAIAPAASAESLNAYINTNTKVYQKASTSSKTMKATKGMDVIVKSRKNGWAQVKRGTLTAYIPLKYITLTSRIKKYVQSTTKLYKSASTSKTIMKLATNTEVYIVGFDGNYYRVQNKSGSVTGYVKTNAVGDKKVAEKKSGKTEEKETVEKQDKAPTMQEQVVMLDWFGEGQNVLKRGGYADLYDIASGKTIRIKRMGGTSHADIEPATAEDTATLKSICGGKWSWNSRAVILIAGGKYVACAINTMPHGDQTITDNDYEGQFCLHMVGSKTHGSDSVNDSHQKAIQKAYDWAHK